MSHPQTAEALKLGLSVGATNLAATLDGRAVLIRPSELTLRGQRLSEFVDRVGDPVPLIAPDGSQHRSEDLLREALGALTRDVTNGAPSQTVVAVPAHWPPTIVDAVSRTVPDLSTVVSDARAALIALNGDAALPRHGVVVLCDFGGSGSSISLADTGADLAPIGDTVRFPDFSGDQIDQTLLVHVLAGLFDGSDTAGTTMVGALTRLRSECRGAKERLSADTATAVVVDLPGNRADIRVTRAELEDLIRGPLTNFLSAVENTLHRHAIPAAAVSAVATIGGGARIPLVTQLLSERLRVPVVTQPHPQLTAAEGATLIARRARTADTATALTPAGTAAAATTVFPAGAPATSAALAWSDDDHMHTEVAYGGSRPEVNFQHDERDEAEGPPRRSPIVLFGLSAAAVVITTVVFALMQFGSETPVEAATTVAPPPAPAAPALPPAPPAPQAPNSVVVKPAQRANAAPQQQQSTHPAPASQHPPVAPTATPHATTTAAPTSTAPTTTPPTTPPTATPTIPPIDPGTGGGTGTETPPIDPGTGTGGTETGTQPIDPGSGADGPAA